jgi:hypothetical protein
VDLPKNSTVEAIHQLGSTWTIKEGVARYLVRNENEALNVYQQPPEGSRDNCTVTPDGQAYGMPGVWESAVPGEEHGKWVYNEIRQLLEKDRKWKCTEAPPPSSDSKDRFPHSHSCTLTGDPNARIKLVAVNFADSPEVVSTALVKDRIEEAVDKLSPEVDGFVINMSFALVPCDTESILRIRKQGPEAYGKLVEGGLETVKNQMILTAIQSMAGDVPPWRKLIAFNEAQAKSPISLRQIDLTIDQVKNRAITGTLAVLPFIRPITGTLTVPPSIQLLLSRVFYKELQTAKAEAIPEGDSPEAKEFVSLVERRLVSDDPLRQYLAKKNEKPTISVAAAGNHQLSFPYFPAQWENVLSVSASEPVTDTLGNVRVDANGHRMLTRSFYTNWAEVLVSGEYPEEPKVFGTSFAAPRVSIAAAEHLLQKKESGCVDSANMVHRPPMKVAKFMKGPWDNQGIPNSNCPDFPEPPG